MRMTFAMRLDNPKNAAIAATSHAFSSLKPCAQHVEVGIVDVAARGGDLDREPEHGLLPRRDVRLAVVGRDLVGDGRVLQVDAQQRAVRDDAAEAVVGARRRDHDHLAIGLGEATAFLLHQRVVVRENALT
jgi:hypothetical protein